MVTQALRGDAGLACAFAPAVDGAGQLALAGTRLAEDKNVGISGGHLPCGFQHRHHLWTVRIQAVLGFAHFAFERFQSSRQLPHLQLLGGGQAQLIGAAGLDQVIGGASLDGVHRGVDRRVCGDDDDPHPWRLDTHLRQHIQAIVFTQAQVEEAQIEHLALQQCLCLGSTVGRGDVVALVFEAVTEGTQDRGLVVHQQNAALVILG